LADQVLDPVLRTLDYQTIQMLLIFRDGHSFKTIADRLGHDERTVGRQFQEIDNAFMRSLRVHIIDREHGQRAYHLTSAGEELVSRLEPISKAMRAAVEATAAATRKIPVLCTSNFISRFKELIEALPADRTFDIVPESKRTAEVNLALPLETQVCLLSALMSAENVPSPGHVFQWNQHMEVLPLEVAPPQLLSVDDLGFRRPVSVREIIESGVTFVTPPGGVVWDFLNWSSPGWQQLRPLQHQAVHDRDFGMQCLANDLIHRGAMIVHSVSKEVLARYGLENAHLYEFVSPGPRHLVAVSGVFHECSSSMSAADDPYHLIWETAKTIWAQGG
jgi:hypothetical protein